MPELPAMVPTDWPASLLSRMWASRGLEICIRAASEEAFDFGDFFGEQGGKARQT